MLWLSQQVTIVPIPALDSVMPGHTLCVQGPLVTPGYLQIAVLQEHEGQWCVGSGGGRIQNHRG